MERIYDLEDICSFEIDILSRGGHKVFLKQNFSIIGEKIHINVYDEGYRKLEKSDMDTPLKLLEILEKLLIKLRRARNYMMDLNKIHLEMEFLYIDANRNLAICFSPLKEARELRAALIDLLLQIDPESVACNDYLNIVASKVKDNIGLEKLITAVGEIKREAYYCGYN